MKCVIIAWEEMGQYRYIITKFNAALKYYVNELSKLHPALFYKI